MLTQAQRSNISFDSAGMNNTFLSTLTILFSADCLYAIRLFIYLTARQNILNHVKIIRFYFQVFKAPEMEWRLKFVVIGLYIVWYCIVLYCIVQWSEIVDVTACHLISSVLWCVSHPSNKHVYLYHGNDHCDISIKKIGRNVISRSLLCIAI